MKMAAGSSEPRLSLMGSTSYGGPLVSLMPPSKSAVAAPQSEWRPQRERSPGRMRASRQMGRGSQVVELPPGALTPLPSPTPTAAYSALYGGDKRQSTPNFRDMNSKATPYHAASLRHSATSGYERYRADKSVRAAPVTTIAQTPTFATPTVGRGDMLGLSPLVVPMESKRRAPSRTTTCTWSAIRRPIQGNELDFQQTTPRSFAPTVLSERVVKSSRFGLTPIASGSNVVEFRPPSLETSGVVMRQEGIPRHLADSRRSSRPVTKNPETNLPPPSSGVVQLAEPIRVPHRYSEYVAEDHHRRLPSARTPIIPSTSRASKALPSRTPTAAPLTGGWVQRATNENMRSLAESNQRVMGDFAGYRSEVYRNDLRQGESALYRPSGGNDGSKVPWEIARTDEAVGFQTGTTTTTTTSTTRVLSPSTPAVTRNATGPTVHTFGSPPVTNAAMPIGRSPVTHSRPASLGAATTSTRVAHQPESSRSPKPAPVSQIPQPSQGPNSAHQILLRKLNGKLLNPGRIIKEASSQLRSLCISPNSGRVFKLIRVLQSAIYGGVFEAEVYNVQRVLTDPGTPKCLCHVAIKIMLREVQLKHKESLQEDISAEIRFQKEMSGHPNVLAYLELWESNSKGIIFVVMPFAEFEDLFEVLQRRGAPFAETEARWLFRQLLDGVRYLHSRGIGFRDHSLENVLMFRDETDGVSIIPKITDPGQAVRLQYDSNHRIVDLYADKLFGKSFRPPEVYLLPKRYNPVKVDVFCIGWMLFFAVTKKQPFDRALDHDTHWPYIRSGRFEELLKIKGQLKMSPLLIDLLQRMLHPDYHQRPDPKQILAHPWFQQTACPIDDRTIHASKSGLTALDLGLPHPQSKLLHRPNFYNK